MTRTTEATLKTLAAIQRRYGRSWCNPSRNTIQSLLQEKYDLTRCVRTVSRSITDLTSNNLVKAKQTVRHLEGQGNAWGPNLYKITGKGWKLLFRLGYQLSWILNRARETFLSHNPSLRSVKDMSAPDSPVGSARIIYSIGASRPPKETISYDEWKASR